MITPNFTPDTPIVVTGGWYTPEIPIDTPHDDAAGVWIVRYMRLDGWAYATRPGHPGQPGVIVHPTGARLATPDESAAALGIATDPAAAVHTEARPPDLVPCDVREDYHPDGECPTPFHCPEEN